MGWGCRHSNTVIIERYDIDGACNVLARRMGDYHPADRDDASYHAGAYLALDILRNHEWRDQQEFFALFDGLSELAWEEADHGVV